MIEQSESIASLAAAMAQAQGSIEGAVKGRVNPAFKSKYADLASVWAACKEGLFDNDLSVMQFPGEMIENRLTLTTQINHKSGEWMRSTLSIPVSKVDAQGYGSAITYARRYALAAVVGVCLEDDDGNAASGRRTEPRAVEEAKIDDAQRAVLMTLANQTNTNMRAFCTYYKIDALPDLPASKYEHARLSMAKKLSADSQQEAA